MRLDLDGSEAFPPDVASRRESLNAILARREFRNVSGPTLLDRFKQWLLSRVIRLLQLSLSVVSHPDHQQALRLRTHEKPTEDVRPNWNDSQHADETAPALTTVSPEELILIETYLSRRWDLDK